MTRTMTFRELVKRIHPDYNPTITDAGGKMNQAVLYKNRPDKLYRLAVRWGCLGTTPRKRPVTPNTHRTTEQRWNTGARPTPRPERWVWKAFTNERPQVNCHVFVTTLGVRVTVVRVTPKRVYFYKNGRRSFANRNNVYVVREVKA